VAAETTLQTLKDLAPWHHAIDLPGGQTTTDGNAADSTRFITAINPRQMEPTLSRLFDGGGLAGRSFLDVGCNAGGYSFLAHEMGASHAVGFDARPHWIDQARFVRSMLDIDEEQVRFETMHMDAVADLGQRFDVTLFKGVFYHLPNPIRAVELLASVTEHVMLIDTATSVDAPDDTLTIKFESADHLMSGVDGLSWYPGGPSVVAKIASAYGFSHHHVLYNRVGQAADTRDVARSSIGRCGVLVAREASTLRQFTSRGGSQGI